MYHTENRTGHAWLVCVLVILPAVMLGVLAMITDHVSPMLWGQQAAAFVVFALLGLLRTRAQKIPSAAWTAVCLLALGATLFFPAVGGARRWLDLGIVNAHAGMLVLPALLVLFGGTRQPYPGLMLATLVLCLQPDFSQLAALALGATPILWQNRRNARWTAVSLLLFAACLIRCAGVPTALEPVPYCEGVLFTLGEISGLMHAAGFLALALVPGYFTCRFLRRGKLEALSLALYYAAIMLFSLSGQYPVPFMGFGLSPILGYWLAYWFAFQEDA